MIVLNHLRPSTSSGLAGMTKRNAFYVCKKSYLCYEKLDKDMFLNNLQNNFNDLKKYLIQIDGFIKKEKVK